MLRFCCSRTGWTSGALALMLCGCAGSESGNGQGGSSPVQTAPAANSPSASASSEPKLADLPELPEGAGEMDADAPKELTPTGSGLYYRILRQSDGKKPKASSNVLAHYHGYLDNGQVFDSSYARGEPTPFPLNRVIKGWTEGLQLIGEGGMIELEIPADLGYGSRGSPPKIRPNATLHFIVELKEVQ